MAFSFLQSVWHFHAFRINYIPMFWQCKKSHQNVRQAVVPQSWSTAWVVVRLTGAGPGGPLNELLVAPQATEVSSETCTSLSLPFTSSPLSLYGARYCSTVKGHELCSSEMRLLQYNQTYLATRFMFQHQPAAWREIRSSGDKQNFMSIDLRSPKLDKKTGKQKQLWCLGLKTMYCWMKPLSLSRWREAAAGPKTERL